jgi:hypothetical protein
LMMTAENRFYIIHYGSIFANRITLREMKYYLPSSLSEADEPDTFSSLFDQVWSALRPSRLSR